MHPSIVTPKLNRLERLITVTLTLHGPQTQADLAEAVQVTSVWYMRNALRTLQLAGHIIGNSVNGVVLYSATTSPKVVA